jgi:hypothetical protein
MIKLTPDLQKKAGAVAAFVLIAVGILYYELRDDSPAPVIPAAVMAPATSPSAASGVSRSAGRRPVAATGTAAKKLGTTSAQLDPTLRMGPMLVTESLVYSGSGRNIFSANSAPVVLPKPIASVRTKGPGGTAASTPSGPPPPPPIALKFFGTVTSENGLRRAFLLHGDDVFLASNGDVVQRRYKIVSVLANSIVVEDLSNDNTQTLPLLVR